MTEGSTALMEKKTNAKRASFTPVLPKRLAPPVKQINSQLHGLYLT
jgi:hypothetical protein